MQTTRYGAKVSGGPRLPNPIFFRGCLVFDTQYRVYYDGGALQNGTGEAHAYVSYSLEVRTGQRQVVHLNDLPNASTNNEAEYVAFVSALVDLRGRIERAGKKPLSFSVAVCTHSQLLARQLTQDWQAEAANLRSLVDEAKVMLQTFGRSDLVKVPPNEVVRVLGH